MSAKSQKLPAWLMFLLAGIILMAIGGPLWCTGSDGKDATQAQRARWQFGAAGTMTGLVTVILSAPLGIGASLCVRRLAPERWR